MNLITKYLLKSFSNLEIPVKRVVVCEKVLKLSRQLTLNIDLEYLVVILKVS